MVVDEVVAAVVFLIMIETEAQSPGLHCDTQCHATSPPLWLCFPSALVRWPCKCHGSLGLCLSWVLISSHLFRPRDLKTTACKQDLAHRNVLLSPLYIKKNWFPHFSFFTKRIPFLTAFGKSEWSRHTRPMCPCEHGQPELRVLLPQSGWPQVHPHLQPPSLILLPAWPLQAVEVTSPVVLSLGKLWPRETKTAKLIFPTLPWSSCPQPNFHTCSSKFPTCSHSPQFCCSLYLAAWPSELNVPSERVFGSRNLRRKKPCYASINTWWHASWESLLYKKDLVT